MGKRTSTILSARHGKLYVDGRPVNGPNSREHLIRDMQPKLALRHADEHISQLLSHARRGHVIDAVATGAEDPMELSGGDPLIYFALAGGVWPEGIGEG